MAAEGRAIVVREYDSNKDRLGVEDVERRCGVGSSGELCLFTDLLGDPISRVRNSPAFLMLVAETREEKEIVGMIRGCIKIVTCGKKHYRNAKNNKEATSMKPVPVYCKVAYILRLRVSPSHRRMGIGLSLVRRIEDWFKDNGAEYSYMAIENDNQASVKLFTDKCGYLKFRTPSILVNPVYAHRIKITSWITIIKLSPSDAENLYRKRFSTTEFFPRDIDSILNNKLSLGTFVAVPKDSYSAESWAGSDRFLGNPTESWAVLSVWSCKDVFTLEVRGASLAKRVLAKLSWVVDRALPWLQLPSIPEVFRPFGLHFMYGIGGEGPRAMELVKGLCSYSHNMAKERGCEVVATEVSNCDPLRLGIPHWRRLSCAEDLWCIKRLCEDYSDGSVGDWIKSAPGSSIFVDPREV